MGERIEYSDYQIVFREAKSVIALRHCTLCNKEVREGDEIYLVFTQGNLPFPNTIIHKSCTSRVVAVGRYILIAEQLHKLWLEAQKYKHWFV